MKIILLAEFHTMFPEEEKSNNPIQYVKSIPKEILLKELSAINMQIKPKNKSFVDTSNETQEKIIYNMCRGNREHYGGIFEKLDELALKHKESLFSTQVALFSRATCVNAIEIILNEEEFEPYIDEEFKFEYINAFVKFITSVNSQITEIIDIPGEVKLENLNASMLNLNELAVAADPMFENYRGLSLFKYLNKDADLSGLVEKYIYEIYGVDSNRFLYESLNVLTYGIKEGPGHIFFNIGKASSFFEGMSIRTKTKSYNNLINIKKGPFYLYDVERNIYLLLDVMMFSEKGCTQFINDFWFDVVKRQKLQGKRENISSYRSKIGYFFEQYIDKLFSYINPLSQKTVFQSFDKLKVKINSKEVELADLYIRNQNKTFIGQVKSSSVYDKEKLSGEVSGLYNNDRSEFFKTFGVNQIVESIKNLSSFKLIDEDIDITNSHQVYPAVILTDKSFHTPFMTKIFRDRFIELLQDVEVAANIEILPLSVILINDLEIMTGELKNNISFLFDVLSINLSEQDSLKPLSFTINENLSIANPVDLIMAEYKPIIEMYSK